MRYLRLSLLLLAGLELTSLLAQADNGLPPRALARLGDYKFYHGSANCAVFSPDGRFVASGDASTIMLWDTTTGERLREWRPENRPIHCLAFSPDSQRLAAGCGAVDHQRSVVVYDTDDGRLLYKLPAIDIDVLRVQFSIDGKHLYASQIEGDVTAWEAATGKQERVWKRPEATIVQAAKKKVTESACEGVLSPDGKLLVWRMVHSDLEFSRDPVQLRDRLHADALRVFDAATDKQLYRKEATEGGYNRLIFSADGQRFATLGPDLAIWNAATGKEVTILKTSSGETTAAAFALTPNLRQAVVHLWNWRIGLWDLEAGKVSYQLCQEFGEPFGLCNVVGIQQVFSADGKTLLLNTSSSLRLWDTATGKERLLSVGHRRQVESLNFSPDGRFLFSSSLETACRWDVRTGQETSRVPCTMDCTPWEGLLAYSADGQLFLDRQQGGRVSLRETLTGKTIQDLPLKKKYRI